MHVTAKLEAAEQRFDDLAKAAGWTPERCEQTGDSPFDAVEGLFADRVRAGQRAEEELNDWRSIAEEAAQDDADWHKLVNSKNEVIVQLVQGIIKLKDRAEAAEARLLVPDELLKIGELIRTQDNRCTDQPLFAVMQQMEVVVDEDYDHDRAVWIFDGVEVNKTKSRRLEALHQGLRDTRGYDRVAVKEIDEFVTACFTKQGCENHISCNGHNLRKPFIHVFGSFRNSEYQLIRDWLSSLGNPVEGGE